MWRVVVLALVGSNSERLSHYKLPNYILIRRSHVLYNCPIFQYVSVLVCVCHVVPFVTLCRVSHFNAVDFILSYVKSATYKFIKHLACRYFRNNMWCFEINVRCYMEQFILFPYIYVYYWFTVNNLRKV